MCFAPWISLTTFIVEFAIATLILILYKKSNMARFFAVFIYLLGMYQLSEFMICTTSIVNLWGTVGFISYTFLPALGLHIVLDITKKRRYGWLLYIPPIVFALIAIFTPNFISKGVCSTVFISLRTFFTGNPAAAGIYGAYYFIFIAIAIILLIVFFIKEKNKVRKKISLFALLAIAFSLIPALILIVVLPTLRVMFPSIFCEFSILFAIFALIAMYLYHKALK